MEKWNTNAIVIEHSDREKFAAELSEAIDRGFVQTGIDVAKENF